MFIDDQAERVNHIESDDNHPLFWGMAKTFCGLVAKKLGSACNFMLHEGRSRRFTVFQITCFTTAV
ncbi:uncharacterized protein PHALS_01621 [Plasmopara halstedii]|uniref:Uncharacterized protein n=1 Tax=Plasmopara halstedii TaxID=4781 RepID=A0A0P1AT23_PLAHL|nr:uncharacterized protein PHALS_01621 [Plasmopara halstedii]CEG45316.1 hypothetical protein PHALS_01621 [Plasmopara halstedii]|eukprot:XP_024581685.1 hypothetical protein PHALS_01621 [Plasmopara halstedii]